MNDLQPFLDRLRSQYNRHEFLSSDPLEFAHRFEAPLDREAVALVGALLAYGNVKQVRRSVQDVLDRIETTGLGPADFVRAYATTRGRERAERVFSGFVHRFNIGSDIHTLFGLLARSWREHGSLGAHFVRGLEPSATDIGAALDLLIADWRRWAREDFGQRRGSSFQYLLTSPKDGSCCKRWCMFLRWVGRNEDVDLGLWTRGGALAAGFPAGRFLRSDQLVIPLDTHTGRITQYLGLSRRKTADWKMALEVTAGLRVCSPGDPVGYDFAIARLGILDVCKRAYRPEVCESCQLLMVCKFAQRRLRKPVKKAA